MVRLPATCACGPTPAIVAGSANNILSEDRHGDELQARGITYAVDYIANSGGTIFDTDRFRKCGFQAERAWANVHRVYDRTLEVFSISDREGIPYYKAADRIAEARIDALNRVRLLDTNKTADLCSRRA